MGRRGGEGGLRGGSECSLRGGEGGVLDPLLAIGEKSEGGEPPPLPPLPIQAWGRAGEAGASGPAEGRGPQQAGIGDGGGREGGVAEGPGRPARGRGRVSRPGWNGSVGGWARGQLRRRGGKVAWLAIGEK